MQKDSTLYRDVHNSGTRLPAGFPAVLATTCRLAGRDIPYSIIPLAKAHLSLLIWVSWA